MLQDDQQLVARDAEIPGLAGVLSLDAVRDGLQQLGISPGSDVRCDYLRYKPGSSCLVAYEASCGAVKHRGYAIAFAGSQHEKLQKLATTAPTEQVVIDLHRQLAVCALPFDRRLPSVRRLILGEDPILARLLPAPAETRAELTCLRYKPERRYVARVDCDNAPVVTIKLYSRAAYRQARRAAKSLADSVQAPRSLCLGHSDRHAALFFEWTPGTTGVKWEHAALAAAREVAALHGSPARKLPRLTREAFLHRLTQTTELLCWLCPTSSALILQLRTELARRIQTLRFRRAVLHGDLHSEQFVCRGQQVSLIDFDRGCLGAPEWDLANLRVDLHHSRRTAGRTDSWDAFADAYRHFATPIDTDALTVLTALRHLELAVTPFRSREDNWTHGLRLRLQDALDLLGSVAHGATSPTTQAAPPDSGLPWLIDACDPRMADQKLCGIAGGIRIQAANLLRYKPGRRAVVEYCASDTTTGLPVKVIGKTEYKPRHARRIAVQRRLWDAGFDSSAADGITVTRPLGVAPEWNMWLQEHVEGVGGWEALNGRTAIEAAQLAARALAKLHRSRVVTPKSHSYSDEHAILCDRLGAAARMAPELSQRIERMRDACLPLIDCVEDDSHALLHRDFYPDQLLFRPDHGVTLLDLDLLCRGPASIDVGNFVGHLTEMGIRRTGDPHHFADAESIFVETYLSEHPEIDRRSIALSKLATLARHVYISQTHDSRRAFTLQILAHCESLLASIPSPVTNSPR